MWRRLTALGRGIPLAAEVLRYLVTGKGILTYRASLAAASVKVLDESATRDVRCHFHGNSFTGLLDGAIEVYRRTEGWRDAASRTIACFPLEIDPGAAGGTVAGRMFGRFRQIGRADPLAEAEPADELRCRDLAQVLA